MLNDFEKQYYFRNRTPIAPLKIVAMDNCRELGEKADRHIVALRQHYLADYLKEGTKVDVRITGATDGVPIRSKIAYKGEYGDFVDKPITLNGSPYNMTVTQKTSVTTNGQLAFLRTQGVEDFLKTQVETLKHTENTFQEVAVENKEKGGGYRRVSVEMTLRGVLPEVEPEKTKKP